jgi:ribonuclease BN (tRNA processing enzyme)
MDQIVFLGTGGARRVMSSQVLSTGGIILKMNGTMLSIDPGPGAIIRATQERINIENLDGVLISHRHLDHCGDVNVMIEAMTRGGFNKKGVVFAPRQAIYEDPVVLKYLWKYVEEVQPIGERNMYRCKNLSFETSMLHKHGGAETYGFIFYGKNYTVAYLPDTRYFEELVSFYACDICIISTLLLQRGKVDHLSVPDVMLLVKEINPSTAILTHFGMQVWRKGVDIVADKIYQATGVNVIAAKDGMVLNLDDLLIKI